MPPLALVGNLSRDVVDGGPPRIGGGAFYGARALRTLGARASVLTRCGPHERTAYIRRVAALGLPVRVLRGTTTTSFAFRYEGDRRIMEVVATGDSWTPAEVGAVEPRAWVHVAPLLRSDFSPETLAALARGRRPLLAGAGAGAAIDRSRGLRLLNARAATRGQSRNSPRATITAEPPTSTRSIRSGVPHAVA